MNSRVGLTRTKGILSSNTSKKMMRTKMGVRTKTKSMRCPLATWATRISSKGKHMMRKMKKMKRGRDQTMINRTKKNNMKKRMKMKKKKTMRMMKS